MATYYWAAPSVAAFNSANWATSDGGASGFGPPGSGDTAVFKGDTNSNANCTITANFTIAVLDMRNNYAGSFRTDGGSYTLTVTGDCAFGCSAAGEVKLGTGASWDIGGNLYTNQILGSLLPNTSIVRLTGSNNTILQGSSLSNAFYILQVDKTSTGGVQLQAGDLDCTSLDILDGDFDLNENDTTVSSHFRVRSGATWTQSTTSTITLDGTQATANTFTYDEVDPIILNRTASGGILQAGPLAARSLTMTDGIWETAGYDVTTSGDIILDCDTVNSIGGGGTWTIGGNFDWKDVGTWAPNNNTVFDMTGSSKYLLGANGVNLTNLTITGSIYIHASTVLAIDVIDNIVIDGTLTIDSGRLLRVGGETGNLYVNTTGTITGDGTVYFLSMRSGYGLILTGGYSYDVFTVFFNPRVGCYIPPGIYSKTIKVHGNVSTSTWQPITGTYTFQGNLQISAIPEADTPIAHNTLNIDNRSAQPSFIVEGNLILQPAENVNSTGYDGILYIYNNHATLDIDWTFSGDVNTLHLNPFYWYAGTGTLEFAGSNNHILDLYNETIDAVVVDKSGGTLTLDYDINPASFQLTLGTFDADIYDVDIDGTGDITLIDGEIYMGVGSTWSCNGNVDLSLVTNANFNKDTAKIIMGGTGKYIIGTGTSFNSPYAVEFSTGSSITIQGVSLMVVNGSCTINGTLNILTGLWVYGNCATTISSSANVTGTYFVLYSNVNGGGLTSYASGKLNTDSLYIRTQATTAADIPAGVYNCDMFIDCPYNDNGGQNHVIFSSGTTTINGFVSLNSSVGTNNNHIDNNSNNPNLIISGYFLATQSGTSYTYWTKGNGLITLTGGSTYIDTDVIIGTLDAIEIDSSGTRDLNSNLDCQSLTGTNGNFDAVTYAVTVGDVDWNADTLDLGSGAWTCSGNFDADVTGVTLTQTSTGSILFTGVSKVLKPRFDSYLYNVTINTGASYTHSVTNDGTYSWVDGSVGLTLNGTLKLANALNTNCPINFGASGVLGGDGNGSLWMRGYAAADGIKTFPGTAEFNINNFIINHQANDADLLPVAGTYTATALIQIYNPTSSDKTLKLANGTYTFDTPNTQLLTWSTGDIIIGNSTNNPNIIFNGSITRSNNSTGVGVWIKGTGSVTLAGDATTYSLDADIGEFEATEVTGDYNMVADFDCVALTINGIGPTFDAGSYDVNVSGDFDLASGNMYGGAGSVWTMSGNADFDGGGFLTEETSKIIFDGSGVTVTGGYTDAYMYKVEFATGFNGTLVGIMLVRPNTGSADDIVINGIIDANGASTHGLIAYYNSDITFGASANYSGTSKFGLKWWNGNWTLPGGAAFAPVLLAAHNCKTGMILPARDYASDSIDLEVRLGESTDVFELQTGNTSFDNVNIGSFNTANSAVTLLSSSNFLITGNLDVYEDSTGNILWSSNGTIYMSGSGNMLVSSNDIPLCGLVINKNSGITLESNLDVDSLTISVGDFDANDFDVTVSPNDTDWTTNGIISMGLGTWTLSGNFDYSVFGGTLTEETSLLVMDGTGKTIEGNNDSANTFYDANIDGTITTAGTGYIYQDGDLNINGTLTLTGQGWRMRDSALAIWTGGIYVNGGGEVTGAGELRMDRAASGGGLLSTTGDLTFELLTFAYPESTGVLPAYDYSSVNEVNVIQTTGGAGLFNWQNGAYTFDDLTLESTDSTNLTVNGYTNQPTSITIEGDLVLEAASTGDILIYNNHATQALDWIIQGDVTLTEPSTGETVWTKGTGGIDFTGTANQSIDLDVNGTLEEFTVNKTGGVLTFTGNWITESFLAVDGELDFNGQTMVTTGDFTINAANGTDATIVSDADAMNATNITVGNDFYVSNVIFNATNSWTLDVQGGSALAFNVDVKYSNANAGLPINATAFGNIDLGENYNWNFGRSMDSMSTHNYPWARMTNRSIRGFRRG